MKGLDARLTPIIERDGMSSLGSRELSLANASFVTDRLLVGGDLDYQDDELAASQLQDLIAAGVTHIVDVRLEWSDEELVKRAAPQIAYLHHGVDDAGQRIPGEWFDRGVGFILDAFLDPDAVVLSHCHMGINRGPSLGYAAMLAIGWDPLEALDAIREARPIAHIAYAENALDWHHSRTAASGTVRRRDRAGMARWRSDNDLDVANVIRGIRAKEA